MSCLIGFYGVGKTSEIPPMKKVGKSSQEILKKVSEFLNSLFQKNQTVSPKDISLLHAIFQIQDVDLVKRRFLEKSCLSTQAGVLFHQYKNYPLMLQIVQMVRDNYLLWETSNSKDLKQIKNKLVKQHQNLDLLIILFQKFCKEEKKRQALRNTLIDDSLLMDYFPYLIGDKVLKSNQLIEIEQVLKHQVAGFVPVSVAQIKDIRKRSPNLMKHIKTQSNLFEIERIAIQILKHHLKDETQLECEQFESYNFLYRIKDPNDSTKTLAFLKLVADGDVTSQGFEKFAYDVAQILGFGDFFVPTKKLTYYKEKQPEVSKLKSGCVEYKADTTQVEFETSFQVFQEGPTLKQYLSEPLNGRKPISKTQLLVGMLINLTTSNFDAHSSNMIISDAGNIIFFDNTRSLPNGNGYLNWSQNIYISFRSALLSLQGSYDSLSPKVLEVMKIMIGNFLNKMPQVKDYFKIRSLWISKLPKGWLYPDKALFAMEERLNRMTTAIDNKKVSCLRDLVFAAIPEFKFVSALYFATIYIPQLKPNQNLMQYKLVNLQMDFMGQVGSISMEEMMEAGMNYGIDVPEIETWCNTPELSFEDILRKIIGKYESLPNLIQKKAILKCSTLEIVNLFEKICKKATYDCKDIHREQIEKYLS